MTTTGLKLIEIERQRQLEKEGWDSEHDDQHVNEELAVAAACYAVPADLQPEFMSKHWPFEDSWWRPSTRLRDLVKAGALIVAEIDRVLRSRDKADLDDSVSVSTQAPKMDLQDVALLVTQLEQNKRADLLSMMGLFVVQGLIAVGDVATTMGFLKSATKLAWGGQPIVNSVIKQPHQQQLEDWFDYILRNNAVAREALFVARSSGLSESDQLKTMVVHLAAANQKLLTQQLAVLQNQVPGVIYAEKEKPSGN